MARLFFREDPLPTADRQALMRRARGLARQGSVTIRDFDQGVVETLGAEIFPDAVVPDNQRYWLKLPDVDPPPGKPGILVTFSFPEAEYKPYTLPIVMVRRDDLTPANERWHSVGHVAYRTPAKSAVPVTVSGAVGGSLHEGSTGFDRMEERQAAIPFDISYTISVLSHYRGARNNRGAVQRILAHILRTFPPYGRVFVRDDIGDIREYEAFMEATSTLDDHPEVAERVLGFGVSIRVEGALELSEPQVRKTVRQPLTVRMRPL